MLGIDVVLALVLQKKRVLEMHMLRKRAYSLNDDNRSVRWRRFLLPESLARVIEVEEDLIRRFSFRFRAMSERRRESVGDDAQSGENFCYLIKSAP